VATARNPDDADPWYYLALAQLHANDRAGYRATCAAMKQRFLSATDSWAVSLMVLTCCLTSEPDADLPALADLVTRFGRNFLDAGRIAMYYRSAKYPEAARASNVRSMKAASPLLELINAMAQYRLGNADAARAALTGTEEWMVAADKQERPGLGNLRIGWNHWSDRAAAHLLHQEAAALIRGKE
jgi:hypothetical protein